MKSQSDLVVALGGADADISLPSSYIYINMRSMLGNKRPSRREERTVWRVLAYLLLLSPVGQGNLA